MAATAGFGQLRRRPATGSAVGRLRAAAAAACFLHSGRLPMQFLGKKEFFFLYFLES
jgi:hypothetical protein